MDLQAMGEGPIVYFTKDGRQVEVALSDVVFRSGTATLRTGTPDDELSRWLAYLAADGRLAPGKALDPPPSPALVVRAAAPGSTGNGITVTVVRNSADPTKVDVIVEEKDVYESLSLDTIGAVLGATATAKKPAVSGSKPGLVRVKQEDPPAPPAPATPAPPIPTNDQKPVATAGTNPPEWIVAGATAGVNGTSFTLVARGELDPPDPIAVHVKDVKTVDAKTTFTLEVRFRAIVTVGGPADLGRVPGDASWPFKPLAFVATFAPPTDQPWTLPAPGKITLAGGAEAAEATSASATLQAGA